MTHAAKLQELYRETVLEHSRHPRNFGRLEDADRSAEGYNPLCGDKVTVYLQMNDDTIDQVTFEGVGCAIALASASIMTEQVGKKTAAQARDDITEIMQQFTPSEHQQATAHGDMAALGGVSAYPSRIRCATLAWKTLETALNGRSQLTTTEE